MTEVKRKVTQQTPKFGLCIDWETSGAVFGGDSSKDFQGISFGAIVFRTCDFEPVEKIYHLVKFNDKKYQWTDGAQKIHGITREHLEQHGVSAEDAAMDLASLILKYWGGDSKIMFLGHNPIFDIRFTNQLMGSIDFEFSVERETNRENWIQLHHVVLDTSALGFITLGLFKSDLLFDRIGFEARGAHNALNDAEMTLETCKAVKSLVGIALGQ
jgi:DNA polymerase III epsilon subunit-like protein